jgi:hypothetical protein
MHRSAGILRSLPTARSPRVLAQATVVAVAVCAALAGCGGGVAGSPSVTSRLTTTATDPTGPLTASKWAKPPAPALAGFPTGAAKGIDVNGRPYGDFKVTFKVAPRISRTDVTGSRYTPEIPLGPGGSCASAVGYCDPGGYKFINFTLRYTNGTKSAEQFGTVGFAAPLPNVYVALPSRDKGVTPAPAYGGPTNGVEPTTTQDRVSYWSPQRVSAAALSPATAASYFLARAYARTDAVFEPPVLKPGQFADIAYSIGPVAPDSPLHGLVIVVGPTMRAVRA